MTEDKIEIFNADVNEIIANLNKSDDAKNKTRVSTLEKKLNILFNGIDTLKANNDLLTIGIVGQMKVGKSSFLNAFLFDGDPVLPKAATPMTAGLTVIQKSPNEGENYIEVEYYTKNEWDAIRKTAAMVEQERAEILKKEPALANNEKALQTKLKMIVDKVDYASYQIVREITEAARTRIGHDNERFNINPADGIKQSLDKYVGARGTFTSVVKALHIFLDDDRLDGIRIVDTPGVNDPVTTRDAKTAEFLREAHGVLMMMTADSVLTADDVDFINNRIGKEGVGAVVLVVNKIDLCYCQYHSGYSLKGAYKTICEDLGKRVRENIHLLNNADKIRGLVFTSGVADSIAQKLPDHPERIDGDEHVVLNNLKQTYPEDFSDENIIESLQLLSSQNATLYKDYIKDVFIRRKDEIIDKKLTSFMAEHRNDVLLALDSIIDEVNNEIDFLSRESLESLHTQMGMLKAMLMVLLPQIQTEILGFVSTLDSKIKEAFQTTLASKRPSISDMPTEPKTINYTREGTRLGWKKNESTYVSILNAGDLYYMEDPQIETFRSAVYKFWNDLFVNERKNLINFILDKITEMATKGSTANVDDSQIRLLVNKLIKTELNGLETLELLNACEEFKQSFRHAMSSSYFTDVKNTFGEMSKDDAQSAIIKDAKSRLSSAATQAKQLNAQFYKLLQEKCYDQSNNVGMIMANFSKQFRKMMEEEIQRHTDDMELKLKSKQESIASAKETLDSFKKIKNLFNALYA